MQSREGEVIAVICLPGSRPDTGMVEIRLMAGVDLILAGLGPTCFLRSDQGNARERGTIRVTGYWVTAGDGEILVATQLAKQVKTVQLRVGWG